MLPSHPEAFKGFSSIDKLFVPGDAALFAFTFGNCRIPDGVV